ncbi:MULTISPECIES: PTS system mannose/fructose/sorbose family transporter subunit IID [Lacticaseibacillus]|uniref:PTS system mannose/fructose/sorbose family transporter subunit IID n=2 Tax=Lacticaseibacillus TaxID=2759736 RepID=A0ABY9L3V6_9LACO|nr:MULTISPECIES: PTS system mannose/fructose/sorbose family transporter subunit IID [Lacticaseibacillus]OFR98947.1 PTS mannose transporter subunit IIAB [Lactobacillus sp. HMSC068F07]MDE3281466.1 PTS system mannose/fructose/sorbose family transporter subunit IID [Lacticaseibacillus casei]MDE3314411.1 PTS system mannose/fructose/sorbose family transporter subunit IID [Lacticaseibacillus zeae]WLV78384.1 PTS system mannose/fructose/sorbose family transporter subunit IID [Lacticaseibacillus sp. NCIM
MTTQTVSNPAVKKSLRSVFWRTFTMGASWEYTRQMATGYAYAMTPALRAIYKDENNAMSQALIRHMQFFNITNVLAPITLGTSIAMEEENNKNPDFDPELINNIKVSLMGPLSAVGDSLILTTWRIICTGISIALCKAGNVFGPILFLLAYNVPTTIIRYFGLKLGYEQGTSLMSRMSDSNIIQSISEKASILGMMVIGAMVPSYVIVNSPIQIGTGKAAVSLIKTLDQILPSMLPILATLAVMWMLKKKWKVGWILIVIIAFSIIGTGLKILSA